MDKKDAITVASLGALAVLAFSAFTPDIARVIGERDKWTCQCGCGKRFQDGYLMDIAHESNLHYNKHHPDYNKPESGRCTYVVCHFLQHWDMYLTSGGDRELMWARASAQRIWDRGIRTHKVYINNPRLFVNDRILFREMLLALEIDVDTFIDANMSRPYNYGRDQNYGKR